MTDSRLPDYLNHIRQAASDACSFVEGQRNSHLLSTAGVINRARPVVLK